MIRTSRFFKRFRIFFSRNSRLFLFLTLILAGVAGGCLWYPRLAPHLSPLLSAFAPSAGDFSGFFAAIAVFVRQSFVSLTSIGLLMLFGMSLFGTVTALLIPAAYGVFVGLCESFLLKEGIGALALSLPGTLLAIWAVLIACAEALRLSLRLVSQVMPSPPKSGLWRDFRLFFLRFLLCFSLALLASAINTTLFVLFG